MDTAAGPGFDTETLRRGIEGQDATALLSLYADDPEPCLYPDGVRVLANSMMSLRDGRIVDQTVLQARDAEG
ncbi:hypothetical protein [Streptomyces sp. NPDC017991]|uniref:hypothetical protein n=1 Tax=Streptomyces sp. NPDC017991 TaxID=3365026 RepID=UPI0037A1B02F